MNLKQSNNKEIIALSTFEAVRLRPQMYIGHVALMDDKLPIIKNNKIINEDKLWSPGFNHLIIEILENAIDEAKRCKGKMKNIDVIINLDDNSVIVKDEGNGFYNAANKHPKTKKNVVRTAFEELHAGSNFSDTEESILGTNGVGSAITNILSECFEVITINNTDYVHYIWKDFKVTNETIRKKKPKEKNGTYVKFIPSTNVFNGFKWDKDILFSYLTYKNFLIQNDELLNKLNLNCYFIENNKESRIELLSFIIDKNVCVKSKIGDIYIWPSYENSTSISFINGSKCTGIHQKIINDWLNEYFNYNLAHHFYETVIFLNVPSTLMKFADQNKTKYAIARNEIESLLETTFKQKILNNIKKSSIKNIIEENIENRLYNENINKIKKSQKISKKKISEKYTAPSKYKQNIFIVEGLSAAGSIKQARNSETDGIYALKGKLKNTKKLSDLTQSNEILEIMNILGIDPSSKKMPTYKRIIIATDEDPDGAGHIASLLINFFNKWFPYIIEQNMLNRLLTPLVVCNYKNSRKYFYNIKDFNIFVNENKISNINYLKGLGSLSIDDWEFVMSNKFLYQIIKDKNSEKTLEMAFGQSSQKRKKWLQSK